MKNGGHSFIIGTIMAGHFTAAFAALGMPPFFALILEQSLHSNADYLAGWLYVVPIFFTAISSPWWGKLADRFGKKRLLLRAQLGLAASSLLAGFATDTRVFFLALVLQGLLGGTFSASNAYLATIVCGTALTRSLTLMQWSARAALVLAPIGLGAWMALVESPLTLYRYLALLPLGAALLIWRLPDGDAIASPAPRQEKPAGAAEASPRQIHALQFAFIFSTVMTFPYFVPFVREAAGVASPALAGWLCGLPHLIYLFCAVPLGHYLRRHDAVPALAWSCLLLAAAMLGQGLAHATPAITTGRIVMGMAMTAAYVSLHSLIAAIVHCGNAGATFGWFESSSKWGAVAGGLLAGTAVQALDLRAPFFIGALIMFITGSWLAGVAMLRTRPGHP